MTLFSAKAVSKKPITETLPEENSLYNSSPEQHVVSEGEALINTEPESDQPISPPFVKAPLEDRSKYEKLTQGAYDATSSNSSSEEENAKTKKKKKITIPEKLHSVYKTVEMPIKHLRSDRNKTGRKNKGKHGKSEKDTGDVESDDSIGSASDLRVDEDDVLPVKEDTISETISESIKTCGSSAYHAECESMATHEEDCTSRIIRTKQRAQAKNAVAQSEDMLFVGHQYGDKPLLMDDELDSDSETKYNNKWESKNDRKNTADIWIAPSSSFEDNKDVFAMAPFAKTKPQSNDSEDNIVQSEDPVSVTFEDHFTECNENQTVTVTTPNSNPFLSPDFVTPKQNDPSPGLELARNCYFGEINFETNFRDSFPGPLKEFRASRESVELRKKVDIPSRNSFEIPKRHSFERLKRGSYEITKRDSLEIPKRNSFEVCKRESFEFKRETLEIHKKEPLFTELVKPNNLMTKSVNFQSPSPRASRSSLKLDFIDENHSSPQEASHKNKKDKKKDKEPKPKYYLIDDNVSDDATKVPEKSKKPSKSSAHKKSSSKSKKIPKVRGDGGFSNMSFEDFPSDELEVLETSIMPFEVLRSPEQEQKSFGMKRIGNPFS